MERIVRGCDNLCEDCWRAWCLMDDWHGPYADSSYLGVYGVGGIWTAWLINNGGSHLMELPPRYWFDPLEDDEDPTAPAPMPDLPRGVKPPVPTAKKRYTIGA